MTVLEWSIKELEKKKSTLDEILGEMDELATNLNGMEVKYNGHYAVITYADGNNQEAQLYVETEDGTSYYVDVSFDELLKENKK